MWLLSHITAYSSRTRFAARLNSGVSLLLSVVGRIESSVRPIRNAFITLAAEILNLRCWPSANTNVYGGAHLLSKIGVPAVWALDWRSVIGIAGFNREANNSFKRMPLHSLSKSVSAGMRHRLTQVLDCQLQLVGVLCSIVCGGIAWLLILLLIQS